jgi:hypothetical protein
MRSARKLTLVMSLALAAMALGATSAFATTVTPSGDYSGTQFNAGTLAANNGVTVTCNTSTFAATILTDGTITVTSLTFANCSQNLTGGSCTVTVDTLPANLNGDYNGGSPIWTQNTASEAATITCGANIVHCEASTSTTLNGTATTGPGAGAEFSVVSGASNNVTIGATSVSCGTAAKWNSTWTIDSPASYSITA